MTLEEVLNELGESPLSMAPRGKQILAYLNGNLTRAGLEKISLATPSDQILTLIYSLQDIETQSTILSKVYMETKDRDSYKSLLTMMATIIAIIVIGAVMGIVKADGPMDTHTADLLKTISLGLLELIKAMMGISN